MLYLFSVLLLALSVDAKTFFSEHFDDGWENRWVVNSNDNRGEWKWTSGKWHADKHDKGIQTANDAMHYGLSAKFAAPVTNDGSDLVIQYSVKNEQSIDCGGAYIKLFGPEADQDTFDGSTPYQIMFGPDICGTTRKTHVIFHYPPKDANLLIKNDVKVETDQLSHLYTLSIKSDGKYEVLIDHVTKKSGLLSEHWDFLEPAEINDPSQSKPSDWVNDAMIADPTDVKPAGYDDVPAEFPDPDSSKPDDWDDDEDGLWEPPIIANPEYKGDWTAKMIANPAFVGEWTHPTIHNPKYKPDDKLHKRCDGCNYIGFELWQVKSGTIFDDILVSDSLDEARSWADEHFFPKQKAEKEMFNQVEEERKEKERLEREERERSAKEDSGEEGEDHEEDHEDL